MDTLVLASFVMHKAISYICPLNILSALWLLILFSKFNIRSKAINWITASSFSVYPIHTAPLVRPYNFELFKWFGTFPPLLYFGLVMLVIPALFMCCVCADKLRIAI